MPTDVQLTLEVVEKNLEAFEKAQQGIEGLSEDFLKLNPILQKDAELMAALTGVTVKERKAMAGLGEETKSTGKIIEDIGKKTEAATKKSGGLQKNLLGMAKGLAGVATVYAGGRWLANLGKDLFEAGREAGAGAAEFGKLETATDRLKTQLGIDLVNATKDVARETGNFIERMADSAEVVNLTEGQLITYGLEIAKVSDLTSEQQRKVFELTGSLKKETVIIDANTGALVSNAAALDRINKTIVGLDVTQRQYTNTIGQTNTEAEIAIALTKARKPGIDLITQSFGELTKEMVFNTVKGKLNEDQALELSRSLGLLTENTFAQASALQRIIERYDGTLAGQKRLREETQKLVDLYALIPERINTDILADIRGEEDVISELKEIDKWKRQVEGRVIVGVDVDIQVSDFELGSLAQKLASIILQELGQ